MNGRREMPADWDDHAGWEAYFHGAPEALEGLERTDAPLPFYTSEALRFAGWIAERGCRRLWFPGCGLDGSPRVYASLGYEVLATDVSPSAVGYQRLLAARAHDSLAKPVMERLRRTLPDLREWLPGTLRAAVHDFREPLPAGEAGPGFDCIMNIRAYQALPPESMRRAARSFFAALRPGGHAFFDTQNVQGERRDRLEDALVEAGFALPGIGAERWLRRAAAETGIPHLFVLGAPHPQPGPRYEGPGGEARRAADRERLQGLMEEYRRRAEEEAAEARLLRDGPETRTAVVVYNTG